jgi:hypothetical protein
MCDGGSAAVDVAALDPARFERGRVNPVPELL